MRLIVHSEVLNYVLYLLSLYSYSEGDGWVFYSLRSYLFFGSPRLQIRILDLCIYM